jgi:hypothetical protein
MTTTLAGEKQHREAAPCAATLSWTCDIAHGERDAEQSLRIIWATLAEKAEKPMGYVPAITSCEILSTNHKDSVHRRIIRNGISIEQKVYFSERTGKIVFTHVGDNDCDAIINEISIGAPGYLRFTMATQLSFARTMELLSAHEFSAKQDAYFQPTFAAVIGALEERLKNTPVAVSSATN